MKYKPSWETTGQKTFHWIVNFNLNYEQLAFLAKAKIRHFGGTVCPRERF
jgi:hypothetical protein